MIQQQIAPHVPRTGADFLGADYGKDSPLMGKKGIKDSEINFRDLLSNSNREEAARREAAANGDLSSAKSNDEFFEKLAEQTREKRVPKNKLGKDDFLKLFVTQLQNQDPLAPNDSAEMAAQLANFNGLEQMQNMNTKLETMIAGQNSSRSIDLVNYIGKEVEIKGGRLNVKEGSPSDAVFKIDMPVSSAKLEVRDSSGKLMHEMNIGSISKGEHKLPWDGKLDDGTSIADGLYSYDIVAKGSSGEEIPVELTSKANIEGLDLNSTSGNFFTNLGKLKVDSVKSVGVGGYKSNEAKTVVSKKKGGPVNINDLQPEMKVSKKNNKPKNVKNTNAPIVASTAKQQGNLNLSYGAQPPASVKKDMMQVLQGMMKNKGMPPSDKPDVSAK